MDCVYLEVREQDGQGVEEEEEQGGMEGHIQAHKPGCERRDSRKNQTPNPSNIGSLQILKVLDSCHILAIKSADVE